MTFLMAVITIVLITAIFIFTRKIQNSPSKLLKELLENYRRQYQANEESKQIWTELSHRYFSARSWKPNEVEQAITQILEVLADLTERADIIWSEKESARAFLRSLLICEKTKAGKARLELTETEAIYAKADHLLLRVF